MIRNCRGIDFANKSADHDSSNGFCFNQKEERDTESNSGETLHLFAKKNKWALLVSSTLVQFLVAKLC